MAPATPTSAPDTRLLRLHYRDPPHLPERPLHVPGARRTGRYRSSLAALPTSSSRPPPHLRRQHPARLVSRRHRRAQPHAPALDLSRPPRPRRHLLVPVRHPRAPRPGRRTPGADTRRAAMSALAPTLEAFFTDRLTRQRQASPHTVAAYRDTFRLLLAFVHQRTGKAPCSLDFADLAATVIGDFLTHLETHRGNSVRTRNARLAAIH